MTLTLSRLGSYAFLLVVLAFASAFAGGYGLLRIILYSQQEQTALASAVSLAQGIQNRLEPYRQLLTQIAVQPEVLSVLKTGNLEEHTNLSKKTAAPLAHILKLRLLAAGALKPDNSETPPLSYACIDLLKRHEHGLPASYAELHLAGTAATHVDLAQPVYEANSRKLLGHVLLSLNPQWILSDLGQQTHSQGYLQLQQMLSASEFTVLAKSGNQESQAVSKPVSVPIANSAWKIVSWPAPAPRWPTSQAFITPGAFLLLSLLLLALAPWVQHRMMLRFLQRDTDTITRLIQDIRAGTLRSDYRVNLREFQRIRDNLQKSGDEIIQDQNALREMANTDQLTGLATRRAFEIRTQQLFEQTRMGFASSLVLIDIDNLKAVNNELGHEAGEQYLKGFAQLLKELLRRSDFITRIGGDEFGIILPFTDIDTAQSLLTRLRSQLQEKWENDPEEPPPLSWSGGLSAMHPSDPSAKTTLKRVEQALLEAKKAGKNQTRTKTPTAT